MRQGFLVLVALAAFIWLRDRQWLADIEDTVPCLLAFPAAYWLGKPWDWRESPLMPRMGAIALCAILFLAGIASESTLTLAISWTVAAAIWLHAGLTDEAWVRIRPLLVIAFLGFPWIYLDCQPLSWWFRLSGATTVGALFHAMGIAVQQQGTSLLVQGMPMDVEPACGGLNALQSLLLGGATIAYIFFGSSRRYWMNIPLLLPIAWLANTLRLIVICASGLTYGVPFAMGLFHKTGGWFVIMLAFAALYGMFSLQSPQKKPAI